MKRYKSIFKEAIENEEVEWYSWAASYFINGDHSGLTDEDIREADDFLDVMAASGFKTVVDVSDDSRFGRPRVGSSKLAGDLVTYTFQKR